MPDLIANVSKTISRQIFFRSVNFPLRSNDKCALADGRCDSYTNPVIRKNAFPFGSLPNVLRNYLPTRLRIAGTRGAMGLADKDLGPTKGDLIVRIADKLTSSRVFRL